MKLRQRCTRGSAVLPAEHLVYETQDLCFVHYTDQCLSLSCPEA